MRVPTRERLVDRGTLRGKRLLTDLGDELRHARLAGGLTQKELGRAARLSAPQISRIERGQHTAVSLLVLTRLSAVLGLDLAVRAYQNGSPVRDAAHLRLLQRLRDRLAPGVAWRTEVPLPISGDGRSWDAIVARNGWTVAVEAETRLRDLQALQRRIALKMRDGDMDRVVLLVADTRTNRTRIREHAPELRAWLPLAGRSALASLGEGSPPMESSLILL